MGIEEEQVPKEEEGLSTRREDEGASPSLYLEGHKVAEEAAVLGWNNDYVSAFKLLKGKKDSNPRYALEWAVLSIIRDVTSAMSKNKEEALVPLQFADRMAYAQRNGDVSAGTDIAAPDETIEEEEAEAVLHAAEEDEPSPSASSPKTPNTNGSSKWWKTMSAIGNMGSQMIKHATGQANKLPTDPEALSWRLECDVIYADAILARSIIQLRINSYVKGAINLRKAWVYYQGLIKVMEQKRDEIPARIKDCIKFGVGLFFIFLTLVPGGLMKVLSAVGFIRDSELGEQYLMEVFEGGGVRAPVSALALLTYHLFVPTGLADVSATLDKVKHLLDKCNVQFPKNNHFFAYSCFYHRKKGNAAAALESIDKSLANSIVPEGKKPPMLLRYIRADALFMGLRWKDAAEAYLAIWEDISENQQPFEYSGQLVLTLAAAYVMQGKIDEAWKYMKLVPSATNPKSKQDTNSPKFPRRCISEPKMIYLAGFYCLYVNRDMAHLMKEALISLEEQLDLVEKENELNILPEVHAQALLFRGVMQKGTGRVAEARASWQAILEMQQALGSESPTLPFGYYELGELEYRQGNLKASKEYFDVGSKLKGDKNDTLANRYSRAINHLNHAIADAKGKA